MRVEEIDALLGGEAQRLADKYRTVPVDFMDGYGWAVTQICRLFPDAVPVRHAKWIEHEWAEESEGLLISNYECSECHTWERNESDYCPKCGARMDAERKDYDKAD